MLTSIPLLVAAAILSPLFAWRLSRLFLRSKTGVVRGLAGLVCSSFTAVFVTVLAGALSIERAPGIPISQGDGAVVALHAMGGVALAFLVSLVTWAACARKLRHESVRKVPEA